MPKIYIFIVVAKKAIITPNYCSVLNLSEVWFGLFTTDYLLFIDIGINQTAVGKQFVH